MVSRFVGAVAVTVIAGVASGTRAARAFDTWWHNAATSAATKELGFSGDAVNVIQVGNFFVDLFGGPYDKAFRPAEAWAQSTWAAVPQGLLYAESLLKGTKGIMGTLLGKRSTLLHFDDLNSEMSSDRRFEFLWYRLLVNTRQALADVNALDLKPLRKKLAILLTLGASLHAVEDFYSHSDWTHQDFSGVTKWLKTPWDYDRPPTFFEVRTQWCEVDRWPRIRSGLWPVPAGPEPRYSHENMAHDNSKLLFEGRDRSEFHNVGPDPARRDPLEHMRYALRGATAADVLWITLVRQDAGAAAALDLASRVNIDAEDRLALRHLDAASFFAGFFPCITKHMDGESPRADLQDKCRGFMKAIVPIAIEALKPTTAVVAVWYLVAQNMFIRLFVDSQIPQRLTAGFGRDLRLGMGYDISAADALPADAPVPWQAPVPEGAGCGIGGVAAPAAPTPAPVPGSPGP